MKSLQQFGRYVYATDEVGDVFRTEIDCELAIWQRVKHEGPYSDGMTAANAPVCARCLKELQHSMYWTSCIGEVVCGQCLGKAIETADRAFRNLR